MKRVLTNLIDNALEAMSDESGKELTIDCALARGGATARLTLSDTGHGISQDDRERLFTPYFSTRENGTGLGLVIASRIVRDHGGYIGVEANRPPRGPLCNRAARMPRILIVDDEPGIRQSLKGVFEDEGFAADTASTGEECLEMIGQQPYELVLIDVWLPGIDGMETLRQIRERSPSTYAIMISGHATIQTAVSTTKLGAYDFIEKPLSLEHTLLIARNALSHQRLEQANNRLRRQLEQRYNIIGESVPIKALRKQIAVVAPTNSRVLIYGESGTGKELVARNIHFLSHRVNEPFVEVNCAAIPEELIESELFGHTKGSFTGASEARKGKFELARGGTVFLDEVGDMTLKTQAKVLRAIEEQHVQPIGAESSIHVDVRIIAATNKNLANEIAAGRFREDLFYRLNVIPFLVPPLRDRQKDIPVMARYFMRLFL